MFSKINEVDIELFRWITHKEYVKRPGILARKSLISLNSWWKEHGAFVANLPRQCGKTTGLSKLIEITLAEDQQTTAIIVVPTQSMVDFIPQRINPYFLSRVYSYFGTPSPNFSYPIDSKNLFIDEYQFVSQPVMDYLLSFDWKSVTMFGSLR